MGNDATGTVAMATNAVQGGRPTTPWRGLIHTFVILVSLFPALALAPAYQWFAPVVLPAQWVAAAIGGHLMRVVYSLLATKRVHDGGFRPVELHPLCKPRCGAWSRARRRNRRGRDTLLVIQARLKAP